MTTRWSATLWFNFAPPYPWPFPYWGGYEHGKVKPYRVKYVGLSFTVGTLRLEIVY